VGKNNVMEFGIQLATLNPMRRRAVTLRDIRKCAAALVVFILVTWIPSSTEAQSGHASFDGMWSDPPLTIEGEFCAAWCTDAGLQRLNALLDNQANDARPFEQLQAEADKHQRETYLRARLTGSALKTYPLDPADDPGFLRCEPWGLARQLFARHQLEIRSRGNDRIELRYGEWDAHRTVYMDRRTRPAKEPPSAMGYSLGRWDGDTLVIETSGIRANRTSWFSEHSDQLRVVERYTRSKDRDSLLLTATLEDRATLREPVVIKKIWRWAPGHEIAPYVDCERPTEFKKGVRP
jgi:hypothetical protein